MKTHNPLILALIHSMFVLIVGADPLWGREAATNGQDLIIGFQSVTNARGKVAKRTITLRRSSILDKIAVVNSPETKPEVLSALARWCIENLDSCDPNRLISGASHPYSVDELNNYGLLSALFYLIAMNNNTPFSDLQSMNAAKQKWGPGLNFSSDIAKYFKRHRVVESDYSWLVALMGEFAEDEDGRMSWDPFAPLTTIWAAAGVDELNETPFPNMLPLKYDDDGMNLIMLSTFTYANMPDEILESMLTGYIGRWQGVATNSLELVQERIKMIQMSTASLKPLKRSLMEKAVSYPDANIRVASLCNPWIPLDLLVKGIAENYDDFIHGVPVAITNLFPGIDPAIISKSFLGVDSTNSIWQRLAQSPSEVRRNSRTYTPRDLFVLVGVDYWNTADDFLNCHRIISEFPPGSPLKTPFGEYLLKVFKRGTNLAVSVETLRQVRDNSGVLLKAHRFNTVPTGQVDGDLKAAIKEAIGATKGTANAQMPSKV